MDKADQLILEQLDKEVPHERTCRVCGGKWQIELADIEFCKTLLIPIPRVCPMCSLLQKAAFRNERSLYRRKSDVTGEEIIAVISPDKKYKVYDKDYWYSDNWDSLDYGFEYDPARNIFDQVNDLVERVPYQSLFSVNNENSEYINHAKDNKNCYLISQAVGNENCYFGRFVLRCQDCIDNLQVVDSQLCYENYNGKNNYNCIYLYSSENCRDSHFSENLTGCKNCCLCFNLNNKQYCWDNKQLSKEEYEKKMITWNFEKQKNDFFNKRKNRVTQSLTMRNCENCLGDGLSNSKNAINCFNSEKLDNCRYVYECPDQKDSYYEYSTGLGATDNYNCNGSGGSHKLISCFGCIGSRESYYSFICINSEHLFGCVGLRNKKYCILNRQYSQKEYQQLIEKIKLSMLSSGEYGEYLSPQISPFGYNETLASEYRPLIKEEALKLGFKWSDYDPESNNNGPFYETLPIKEYFDENKTKELLAGVLKCEVTGKPFKIMGPELAFYLKHNIPIPKRSPNQRHKDRMALKNPYKLWHRQCMCEGQLTINNEQLTGGMGASIKADAPMNLKLLTHRSGRKMFIVRLAIRRAFYKFQTL